MKIKTIVLLLACSASMLQGCSSVKVWPFGDSSSSGHSRTPANSTEYQCDNGKHFYVRLLDGGNTAWLIYPDREVGLAKAAGSGDTRYTNGIAVLIIGSTETTLTDGALTYQQCKTAAPAH